MKKDLLTQLSRLLAAYSYSLFSARYHRSHCEGPDDSDETCHRTHCGNEKKGRVIPDHCGQENVRTYRSHC